MHDSLNWYKIHMCMHTWMYVHTLLRGSFGVFLNSLDYSRMCLYRINSVILHRSMQLINPWALHENMKNGESPKTLIKCNNMCNNT